MTDAAYGLVLVCTSTLLTACAVPVAYPRTGQVLQEPGARVGGVFTTGVAPTTVRVTTEGSPPTARTYRGLSPTVVEHGDQAS